MMYDNQCPKSGQSKSVAMNLLPGEHVPSAHIQFPGDSMPDQE